MPISTPPPTAPPAIVVRAPQATLHLEVARTDADRERGLMYRTSLPANTGMLFVFGSDGPVDFWMKNTLIPLDMVFVAADGTVRKVFARVPVVSPALPDGRIPLEESPASTSSNCPRAKPPTDGIVPGTNSRTSPRSARSETRRCPNCPRSRPSFAVSPTPSLEKRSPGGRAPAQNGAGPVPACGSSGHCAASGSPA